MVWELSDDPTLWPDPYTGEHNGFVAVGGDLTPQRLISAYSNGFFPWYGYKIRREIRWYCPVDRFVIFPEEIHISHSMRQLINKHAYTITKDQSFDLVIENCSKVDQRDMELGAWIGTDIKNAYTELHRFGYVHSIEVWDVDHKLVGGLYGVSIGNSFFGESMFSLVPNASKLALIFLAEQQSGKGGFIDCQFETPHLKSMGGRHIPYDEYMQYLRIQ